MNGAQASEHSDSAFPLVAARGAASSASAILAGLAAAKFLLQIAGITRYGFFRDELYYMACGEHLAWGYVDQPPFIAFAAWFARHVGGHSIVALRIWPVLGGTAVVFLTGVLARELGGGRFAQFFAALAVLFAPGYLAFDSFFSMNAFEPLFWLACALIAVRIVQGASPRLWLAFGALAGIGLENKHSILVFGFGMVAGFLLSGQWQIFRSKWIWIGGLIALALFTPNLLWEARHGWPQIEVVRNAQIYKNEPITPMQFLFEQILFVGPLALPIWISGLVWLFFAKDGKAFRFLGWAYLILITIFIVADGKSYYPLPIYTLLLAAGSVAFEQFLDNARWAPVRTTYPALLVLSGLFIVPFGVPLLPVESFVRFSQLLPYSKSVTTERDALHVELPQLYADMFGWENTAQTVAHVYLSLPADERSRCAILGGNYGESGAIDYYGPALGLPKAIGGHNAYYDWGPREYSGSCVIIFGERASDLAKLFGDSQLVATASNPHAMPIEQSVPVYVCRKPSAPLSVLWPHFKMII